MANRQSQWVRPGIWKMRFTHIKCITKQYLIKKAWEWEDGSVSKVLAKQTSGPELCGRHFID